MYTFNVGDTPTYKYTTKDVIIGSQRYSVEYIDNHSAVQAVIYKRWDAYASDSYANTTSRQLVLGAFYKGEKEWTWLYSGDRFKCSAYPTNRGLFGFLFSLETKEFQEDWLRTIRIIELEKKIPALKKELEKLKSENDK